MPLLLDTCALLWIAEGGALGVLAASALADAHARDETVWISPISAWELGLLVARGRIALSTAPQAWFGKVLAQPGIELCELEPEVLISSSFLPGSPPRDPADRIILASARALGLCVLTRDNAILAYGQAGHVATLPC